MNEVHSMTTGADPLIEESRWLTAALQERAHEIWIWCFSPRERIDYIRKNRSQFEFHSYGHLVDVVRGRCFNGCALKLINWRNRVRVNMWRAASAFCIATWSLIIFIAIWLLS
ncbi:hypothetical protein AYJ54_00080 [Bradyrhizobium centrolobii]|uniref:Uncharacterized protein n=2 Tax=Nitrobacteraceae TaxID=41294 RepID=A0A176YPF3_9BRAD|nr:hypothetical protein AYJ54_00080 [Bradyrhizobium centrolobii]